MLSKDLETEVQILTSKKTGFMYKALGSFPSMKQICYCCDKVYFLSASNQLFSLQTSAISRVSLPVRVLKISSSKETILLLAEIGVYYLGYDILSNSFACTVKVVNGLEQVKFIEASIGISHASGIDDLGNLYLWGSAYGSPHFVESAKVFSSSKVICGDFITALCTGGGYFYVYGWFTTLDVEMKAYTLPELEKYFIVDLCIGSHFCGLLTEEGVVLGFDNNKELIRMPGVTNVKQIFPIASGIIAFTETNMYKWYGNSIREWQIEVFLINSDGYSVLGTISGGLAIQGAINLEFFKAIESYRTSYDAQPTVISNPFSFSGLTSPKSLTSPVKGSNYSNFFPVDDTYNKLLHYRRQHKQTEVILNIIKPLAVPILKFALTKLKRFSDAKLLMSRTAHLTLLPTTSERIFQKVKSTQLAFAFEQIVEVFRAYQRKQAEIIRILYVKSKYKVDRFDVAFRRIAAKERNKFGKIILKKIKFFIIHEQLKVGSAFKLLGLSRKIDKFCVIKSFLKWIDLCEVCSKHEEAFLRLEKLFIKKHGSFAMRLIKSFHFFQSLKFNKLKIALMLLHKHRYIQEVLWYYTKWCQLLYSSIAKKEKSKRLYYSLAKNMHSVLSHRLKNNLKWSFHGISRYYFYHKLIKVYKHPLLYFMTVFSKILCRLKFSTFSAIQRSKDRSNLNINLFYTDKISSMWYILQNKSNNYMSFAFKLIRNYNDSFNVDSIGSKNNTLNDLQEHTLTFFNQMDGDYDNPFIANQTVPKLPLGMISIGRKPPVSTRHNEKCSVRVPWKAPNRSGSYGGNSSMREDSLTRRKNYDSQLRKKLKNNDKFSKKSEEVKAFKLIPQKAKRKYIEVKSTSRDPSSSSDEFFKISLGMLTLKRFYEKYTFSINIACFKVLKSCFKTQKASYSKRLKYNQE